MLCVYGKNAHIVSSRKGDIRKNKGKCQKYENVFIPTPRSKRLGTSLSRDKRNKAKLGKYQEVFSRLYSSSPPGVRDS